MQAGECGQPTQAGKRKQHNCGQTGKQNAGRKVPTARQQSDTYQPPITTRSVNTLSPASFLIQRTKSPACSRFTPGASGAGHYLTLAILPATALPTLLLRQLFSRKLFQLRINLSFRLLHSAIQKCIRISKLFISIRLLAIKHSHNLF